MSKNYCTRLYCCCSLSLSFSLIHFLVWFIHSIKYQVWCFDLSTLLVIRRNRWLFGILIELLLLLSFVLGDCLCDLTLSCLTYCLCKNDIFSQCNHNNIHVLLYALLSGICSSISMWSKLNDRIFDCQLYFVMIGFRGTNQTQMKRRELDEMSLQANSRTMIFLLLLFLISFTLPSAHL